MFVLWGWYNKLVVDRLFTNGWVYVSLVAKGCEKIGLSLEGGDSHETEQGRKAGAFAGKSGAGG
jgi:hypothetical protein